MACDWKQLAGVLAAAGVWTWMSIYSERGKKMEEAAAVVQPAANAVAGFSRVPPEILNAFPVQFPEEIVEFIMELKEKREREREEAMHAHPRARAILQGLALLSNHLNPGEIVLSLLIRLKSDNPTLRSKLVKHVHRMDRIFQRPEIRAIWRAANGWVDKNGTPPVAFRWLLRDVEVAQHIFSTHWDWEDLVAF